MKTPRVPLAKEGYPFIFFFALATIVLALVGCPWAAYLGLLASLFVISFFRDPERFTPQDPTSVISPADGKIISVESLTDHSYLQGSAQRVCIFMNVFNVHVNRNPLDGIVKNIIYTPGKFYAADSSKADFHNEKCATILETGSGQTIAFVQIAGLIARRIVNWLEHDDRVKKGERMGLIRFGSRVDVYLPVDARISVTKGEKVRAGETVIAQLSDKECE